MKKKNLGAPDYANVQDISLPPSARKLDQSMGSKFDAFDTLSRHKPDNSPVSNYTQKTDKGAEPKSYDISKNKDVLNSVSSALQAMGNFASGQKRISVDMSAPLPSRKNKK